MIKKICLLAGLLVPFIASAGAVLTGEVTELWVNDNSLQNGAYVATGQLYSTPCQPNNQVRYFVIDFDDPGMNHAYAMALSAYMNGKPVTLGGSSECHGQHEKLKYIFLKK